MLTESIPQNPKLKSKVVKMLACPVVSSPNLNGVSVLKPVVVDEVVAGYRDDNPT